MAANRSLDKGSVLGLVLAFGGICGGLMLEGGSLREILQPTAAMIVFGGTVGATMLGQPFGLFVAAFRRVAHVMFETHTDPQAAIRQILEFATKARKNGIVSLEKDALAVISAGLEAGINFLDDARYDDRTGKSPLKSGYSEVVFGDLLRKGGWNRSDLVIANKLWYEFYPQQSPEEELNGSLSRLKMDYIDLIYCAPPPASLPVAGMVKQMDDLIKTGKVRYWGILNWPLEKIEEAYQVATAEGMAPPCATQLAYSVVNPSPVEDEPTQAICRSAGIGIVASYCL